MPSASNPICLLDDEPSVVKSLARLLASEGLATERFTDPARFLEHACNHPVRLAIIDFRMPGMTGLEVMDKLRAISPEAQVILMTGENDSAHRTGALTRGAAAFFLKPFDDEALLIAVRAAMAA